MKYKKLTKEQIIISFDRLTRFKKTRDKYLRVFSDILVSSLIEPKLKRSEIENLDYAILSDYVSEIINTSLETIYPKKDNSSYCSKYINKFLCNYENSIFINDNETQKLLNNNINYSHALHLISDDCPINLKWLYTISKHYELNQTVFTDVKDNSLKILREKNLIKFPIEEVLLVEGITEEILLPAFARYLGYDFYAKGVQVIAAGGKNQVVKMYYELSQELKIPIFVLLDKDAEENINQIKPRLRSIDRIHLVSCGEFEDLLSLSLIIKTVNAHFINFLEVSENDFSLGIPKAKILEEIFKTRGLHEFKKAEFAKLVKEQITEDTDISSEIAMIIKEISCNTKQNT